jgi:hypothetical protein
VTLLPDSDSIVSLIDSTVPHLWLPRPVCDAFATAFGLVYDSDTDLYLVNDTTHRQLRNLNPTVTLILSAGQGEPGGLNVELPYDAFDLQASYPYYQSPQNYFPIRRADNDTQYTLGRTFLQEAFIVVDYERSRFSVSKAAFNDRDPSLVAIPAKDVDSSDPKPTSSPGGGGDGGSSSSSGLSTGAKAGIGVGAALGVLILLAILAFFLIRRRRAKKNAAPKELPADANAEHKDGNGMTVTDDGTVAGKAQLDANEGARYEMPGAFYKHGGVEADSQTRFEMAAGKQQAEMDGSNPVLRTPLSELPSPEPRHELPSPEHRHELP